LLHERKEIDEFLRATAGTAIARLSHRNYVCPSVCHTGRFWQLAAISQRGHEFVRLSKN